MGDLAALIADVPTMTGSRITHTDDTFGLCAPFGGGRSLGWTGTAQVFFCDKTLVSLDYARHRLSTSIVSTDGDAKDESTANPVLTGDRVVWTRTTEKPQSGLNQPLFSGTLVSIPAVSLTSPRQTAVFTDTPAPLAPEFFVLAAGNGFAVVGGRPAGSVFIGNSATAPTVLYDLRGKDVKKVDVALPPYVDGLANGTAQGVDVGLLPLWETTGGVGAYLDTGTGRIVSGFTLDEFLGDGGCGRIAAAPDPSDPRDIDVGTGDSTARYVIAVPTSSGLTGGTVTSAQHQSMSVIGFTPGGILVTDDSGLTLVGFDGTARWSIPRTVATQRQRVLGRVLMTNASGEPVVVDELTGKEITDPDDAVAQFMTSIAKGSGSGAGSFSVVQAGGRVVLSAPASDGQASLVIARSVACPSVAVPGATTPLAQLFPH